MAGPINKAVFKMPRNGTASRTVNLNSATNLAAGTPFIPTDGSLLLMLTYGPSLLSAPSGWTQVTNGFTSSSGAAYLYQRAGSAAVSTIPITSGSSNFPLMVAVYEFAPSSAFVKLTAGNVSYDADNPAITDLTGTNYVMAFKGRLVSDTDPYSFIWSATGSTPVEDFDIVEGFGPNDGWVGTVAYIEDFTATSWTPRATSIESSGTYESFTWAVNAATPVDPPTPLDDPVVSLVGITNPTTPTGTDGTVTISWTAVANADRYRVEIAPGHDATTGWIVVDVDATSPRVITALGGGDGTAAVTAFPAEV